MGLLSLPFVPYHSRHSPSCLSFPLSSSCFCGSVSDGAALASLCVSFLFFALVIVLLSPLSASYFCVGLSYLHSSWLVTFLVFSSSFFSFSSFGGYWYVLLASYYLFLYSSSHCSFSLFFTSSFSSFGGLW